MSLLVESTLELLPLRYRPIAKQFLKFAITGVIGTLVDFGTYTLLTRIVGWNTFYILFGQKILAANNVSVFLAIISNFIINRYWTFNAKEGNVAKQWGGYFALNFVTWVLNQLLVSFFTFNVAFFEQAFGDTRDIVAKAAAIVIILFINFFGSKFLVFRSH